MVDVSGKPVTERRASASAIVRIKPDVLDALLEGSLPKGDGLATARIAGILAAKNTPSLIPLCHVLPLDDVEIGFERTGADSLMIRCSARATTRTGVEMEALTGACVAALTLYDMAKSADKGIVIGPIQLESKTGGKSGEYRRGTVP